MDKITLILPITKCAIALIIVCSITYFIAAGITIPEQGWQVATLVLTALFGTDAIAQTVKAIQSSKNK